MVDPHECERQANGPLEKPSNCPPAFFIPSYENLKQEHAENRANEELARLAFRFSNPKRSKVSPMMRLIPFNRVGIGLSFGGGPERAFSLFFRRGTVNFYAVVLREPYGFLRVRRYGGKPGGGEFLRPREGLGAKPVQFGGL